MRDACAGECATDAVMRVSREQQLVRVLVVPPTNYMHDLLPLRGDGVAFFRGQRAGVRMIATAKCGPHLNPSPSGEGLYFRTFEWSDQDNFFEGRPLNPNIHLPFKPNSAQTPRQG